MAKKREADAAVIVISIVIGLAMLTGGAVLLAYLMYRPLEEYTDDEQGKDVAVLGICLIVIGILVGAGEFLFSESRPFALSAFAVGSVLGGIVLYGNGLSSARQHALQFASFLTEVEELIARTELGNDVAPELAKLAQGRGLSESETRKAIAHANLIQAITEIERGYLPVCDPPELVFLRTGERCHAWFAGVGIYGEVKGRSYEVSGAAVHWKVSSNMAIRPSAYSAKSIPVAQFKRLDHGLLVVTNCAVLVQGDRSTFRVPLSQIVGLSAYANGFQVHTAGKSGRELFEVAPQETRLATLLISHLIRDDLSPRVQTTSFEGREPKSEANGSNSKEETGATEGDDERLAGMSRLAGELADKVSGTILRITQPIAEVMVATKQTEVPADTFIRNEMHYLFVRFATVNGPVSKADLPALARVWRAIRPDFFPADGKFEAYVSLGASKLKGFLEGFRADNDEMCRAPLSKPVIIRALEAYDLSNDTDLAAQALQVVTEMAHFILHLDGQELSPQKKEVITVLASMTTQSS